MIEHVSQSETAYKEYFQMPDPSIPIRSFVNSSRQQSISVKPHWHEAVEILYMLEGTAVQRINDLVFGIYTGDIVIINGLNVHSTISEGNEATDILVLQFDPRLLNTMEEGYLRPLFFSKDPGNPHLVNTQMPIGSQIKEHMMDIYHEFADKSHGYELAIKSDIYRILCLMLRSSDMRYCTDTRYNAYKIKLQRLQILLDYIDRHYEQPIELSEAAEMIHMSRYHFCRFFKKTMGKTFIEYLNETRIEKAHQMIISSDKTISEIAFEVGFNSVTYFNRLYKSIKHCTPTAARQSLHS